MWPNRRLLDLIGIELPIIQAPMAGANGSAMAVKTAQEAGLANICHLKGGIDEWKKANGPLAGGEAA